MIRCRHLVNALIERKMHAIISIRVSMQRNLKSDCVYGKRGGQVPFRSNWQTLFTEQVSRNITGTCHAKVKNGSSPFDWNVVIQRDYHHVF